MISNIFVRYKHETSSLKDAKPNQEVDFVRYNREFVITVIVITEFDCIFFLAMQTQRYKIIMTVSLPRAKSSGRNKIDINYNENGV